MEDGPEDADGTYDYAGKTYRLEERDSEVWQVFDGDRHLGDLIAKGGPHTPGGPTYVPHCVGTDNSEELPPSDHWQAVLEWLVDQSAPPVGG